MADRTLLGTALLMMWTCVLVYPGVVMASSAPLPEITILASDLPDCVEVIADRQLSLTSECEFDIELTRYLQDSAAEPNTVSEMLKAGEFVWLYPESGDGFVWETITWRTMDGSAGQLELSVQYVTYPCPSPFSCMVWHPARHGPVDPGAIIRAGSLLAWGLRRRKQRRQAL